PGGPSPVFGRAAGRLGERVGAAPPSLRPGDSRRPSLERVRRSVSLTGSPPSATLRPRSRPAGFLDRLRLRRRSEDEGPFPMVKSLMIVPDEVRRSETIQLGSIPVNTYRRTLENELADGRIRPEEARRIHRDMVFIREFESMLDQVKKLGSYAGIAYEHKG